MAWFPDLSTETMITSGDHVRAIGWLSAKHAFPTGESPPEFVTRLSRICRLWPEGLSSLQWGVFMGPHRCDLCGSFLASGNIGVPAEPLLYVAPEMVHHYVEVHRYAPPPEFVAAVMAAPMPGTPEYHVAVAAFREFEMRRMPGM